MRYLIDEPGPFEPIEVWQDFLETVKRLPQDDPGVKLARESAERHIATERRRRP